MKKNLTIILLLTIIFLFILAAVYYFLSEENKKLQAESLKLKQEMEKYSEIEKSVETQINSLKSQVEELENKNQNLQSSDNKDVNDQKLEFVNLSVKFITLGNRILNAWGVDIPDFTFALKFFDLKTNLILYTTEFRRLKNYRATILVPKGSFYMSLISPGNIEWPETDINRKKWLKYGLKLTFGQNINITEKMEIEFRLDYLDGYNTKEGDITTYYWGITDYKLVDLSNRNLY